MSDEVEDELIQALQGDETAIHNVAQLLKERKTTIDLNTQAQVHAMVTNRQRALAAQSHFLSEYRDIAENPMAMALAEKLEAQEAAKNPQDTNYLQRFRKIGKEVRGMLDGSDGVSDEDYAESVVRNMTKSRRSNNDARTLLNSDEDDQVLASNSRDADEREMERRLRSDQEQEDMHKERIQEMIAERRKLQQSLAE